MSLLRKEGKDPFSLTNRAYFYTIISIKIKTSGAGKAAAFLIGKEEDNVRKTTEKNGKRIAVFGSV